MLQRLLFMTLVVFCFSATSAIAQPAPGGGNPKPNGGGAPPGAGGTGTSPHPGGGGNAPSPGGGNPSPSGTPMLGHQGPAAGAALVGDLTVSAATTDVVVTLAGDLVGAGTLSVTGSNPVVLPFGTVTVHDVSGTIAETNGDLTVAGTVTEFSITFGTMSFGSTVVRLMVSDGTGDYVGATGLISGNATTGSYRARIDTP